MQINRQHQLDNLRNMYGIAPGARIKQIATGKVLTVVSVELDQVRNGKLIPGGTKITLTDGTITADYHSEHITDAITGGRAEIVR
jgi:hypothetical protein